MFDVLMEAAVPAGPVRGGALPAELGERYAGPLAVAPRPDRPTIVANFVESLDGLVALEPPFSSSSRISGSSEPDRFVMGLLRSLADAVLIGAGTLREAAGHEWTPRGVAPRWAEAMAGWRRDLGLPAQPTTVVVSARGDLPLDHHGLTRSDVPAVVVTTAEGAARLGAGPGVIGAAGAGPIGAGATGAGLRVQVAHGEGDDTEKAGITAPALVGVLHRMGARVVLCEGGPHLMGRLLAADAIDELFLTLAPQLLGRSPRTVRYGMVEGQPFVPADAPWARLLSVRRADSHLFLRYALDGRRGEPRRASASRQ